MTLPRPASWHRAWTPPLSRAVEVTVSGSLMTWAFYRDKPLADWMRDELDRLFAPYRPEPSPPRPSSPRGRGGRKTEKRRQ
jgi:hypothetical protein